MDKYEVILNTDLEKKLKDFEKKLNEEYYTACLEKRVKNLEKRFERARNEMEFLRHSYVNQQKSKKFDKTKTQIQQLELFA